MNMSLEEYILKYEGYVSLWALHYYNLFSEISFELDDLYQAGCLGLIEGYFKYDNSKASPSTYAYITAKFAIIKYMKSNLYVTKVPNDINVVFSKYLKAKGEYYKTFGKDMSIDEMISFLKKECFTGSYKVDENYVNRLIEIENFYLKNRSYSLADRIDNYYTAYLGSYQDKDNVYVEDIVTSSDNVEETAILHHQVDEIINFIMTNFSNIDLDIFEETFGLVDGVPKTKEQIGKKYGITHQAIHKRYQKVLKKVQQKFNI